MDQTTDGSQAGRRLLFTAAVATASSYRLQHFSTNTTICSMLGRLPWMNECNCNAMPSHEFQMLHRQGPMKIWVNYDSECLGKQNNQQQCSLAGKPFQNFEGILSTFISSGKTEHPLHACIRITDEIRSSDPGVGGLREESSLVCNGYEIRDHVEAQSFQMKVKKARHRGPSLVCGHQPKPST